MASTLLMKSAIVTPRMVSVSKPRIVAMAHAAPSRPCVLGGARLPSALKPTISRPARQRQSVAVSASKDVSWNFEADEKDYSALVALAGFAAVYYNKIHIDVVLLIKAVAWLQLAVSVFTIVTKKYDTNRVTTIVGPAILAAAVLNVGRVTVLDTSTGLFGYYLAERLEEVLPNTFWLWVATLIAALYTGYGTQWYTGAFALTSLTKLFKDANNDGVVHGWLVPLSAAAAFALHKEYTVAFSLAAYLAHVLWAGVSFLQTVAS